MKLTKAQTAALALHGEEDCINMAAIIDDGNGAGYVAACYGITVTKANCAIAAGRAVIANRATSKTYRLASCDSVYAPNVIAFCISTPRSRRKNAINILCSGWGIPHHVAKYLCTGGAYTIEGQTVVVTA